MAEKVTRKRLADGTVKEYRYPREKPKPRKRTVGMVIDQYRQTAEYKALKPNSAKVYDRALGMIEDAFGAVAIAEIRRGHVKGTRDKLTETPGLANQVLMAWGVVLAFAVEAEYIPYHPALRIKRLATGEWKRWPIEAIEYADEWLPEPLRRAMVLALYTGQREGDCCKMTWADYKDGLIAVVQEKTGEKVWIPTHSALRDELDAWKKKAASTHILVSASGRPWKASSFCTMFNREVKEHAALDGLVFHGLRKSAAATLAEAGCDVLEIASITGHTDLKTLQLYVREAQRKRLAQSAILKLENFRQ